MLHLTPESVLTLFPPNQMSLQRCGEEEAQRFKWIQSQKEGRDLGDHAIRTWIMKHWNGFLRHRWLEHLQGKTYWLELDPADFGLLQREFCHSRLIDPILDRLKVLKENLDIIVWAHEACSPEEVQEVLKILEALDVNGCRIQADFDPRRRRRVEAAVA
ncbi:MAG: hypothetical protein ACP5XB_20955 [Isosphaeraceae bacterium]